MTKLRHENPPHWGPDPGAVIQVPESTRPSGWVPPKEQARLTIARAEEEKARVERFKLLHEAVKLELRALNIEQKQERGERLSFFEQAALDRWQQIRGWLQSM